MLATLALISVLASKMQMVFFLSVLHSKSTRARLNAKFKQENFRSNDLSSKKPEAIHSGETLKECERSSLASTDFRFC